MDKEYQKKNIELLNTKILKNNIDKNISPFKYNNNSIGNSAKKNNKRLKKVTFNNRLTDKIINYNQKSMFYKNNYNNFDNNEYGFNNLNQNNYSNNNYNKQSRFVIVKDKKEPKLMNYEEPKKENKFSWDTIEKSSSVRFMNQDEIMKLINDY